MFLVAVLCLVAGTQSPEPIYQMSPAQVDAYLSELQTRQPDFGARLIDLAKRSVNTPYARDPLGEGPSSQYDKDPLMDLTRVDCVTFVEQSIALAASRSYQNAFDTLQKIRYEGGQIAFERRNHFMIADWVAHNRFCRDVTRELKTPTATVTRTMGRKYFFESKQLPELAQQAKEETLDLAYVPVAEAANAEKNLPSPALILLIGKVDWLFTLHCGLFVRNPEGKGLFYNASSTENKVVADDFLEVFAKTTRYLGFTAYKIQDPCAAGTVPVTKATRED